MTNSKSNSLNKYSIFDIRKGIWSEDTIVEASTSIDAVRSYLKPRDNQKIKRVDGNTRGIVIVTKYSERDGKKYKSGNSITYGLVNVS